MEGDALRVIAIGHALGWTEDCSVFWGTYRLVKYRVRLHADYHEYRASSVGVPHQRLGC